MEIQGKQVQTRKLTSKPDLSFLTSFTDIIDSKKDLLDRTNMIPLKRGGHPDEAAALMVFLLSNWSQFITGQMIPLTGGDWL